MIDKSEVFVRVCEALANDDRATASITLRDHYPFTPLVRATRRYSPLQCTKVFVRDGFIDRYSGGRLIFPGALRLIATLLPSEFPFHTNWKTDVCHFAFYEFFPTIDHVLPITRGGTDSETNMVSTSMLRNAAKANFTLDELGWHLRPPGTLRDWDGLTSWFLQQQSVRPEINQSPYLRKWVAAARAGVPA